MMEKQAYTEKKYKAYESNNLRKINFQDKYTTVIIPSKNDKFCVCVSCQAGCPIGCKICHTKFFERNLATKEIIEQIEIAKKRIGKNPTSVVFMGMGEPLLNFKNVDSAIHQINKNFGIAYNKITLSTVGIKLDKYKKDLMNAKYNIAISLHATTQEIRDLLIPNSININELINIANKISESKKNGVMIGYCLIKDVNDTEKDIQRLLNFNWHKKTNFNLIEFNDSAEFKKSEKMLEFKQQIRDAGYKCFIRESRGKELKSACGMLNFEN